MNRLVGAIVVAAAGTMLELNRRLNVWEDEGYTLATTARRPLESAAQAMRFEQYPPLYFVALSGWRRLNASPAFARAFSTLFALATIRDASRAVTTYAPDADRAVVAAALAVHPTLVWAGTEARAYSSIMWISSRIMLAYHDAYVNRRPPQFARACFVMWSAVGIYTHYYVGFLIAGCALATLGRRGATIRFAFDAAAIGMAIIPLARALREQMSTYGANFVTAMPPMLMVRNVAGTMTSFVLPSDGMNGWWRPLAGCALTAVGAIAGTDRKARRESTIPMRIALGAAALFGTALQIAKTPPALPQHATPLLVPALVAAAAILRTRRRIAVGAVVIIGAGLTGLRETVRRNAKIGDWKRVAEHLHIHEASNEPVIVFQPEATLPLAQHYRGPNAIAGLPIDVAFDRYDLTRYTLRDDRQIDAALDRARATGRFWLVTTMTAMPLGNDLHAEVLDAWIARHATVEGDAQFYGSRVRRLRRRAQREIAGAA